MFNFYWDKLGEVADHQLALVARLVSQADVDRTPAAEAAMGKEWKNRRDVPLFTMGPEMLPERRNMYTDHGDETFVTGLIRGNFEDKSPRRWCRRVDLRTYECNGVWVSTKEVLRAFTEACPGPNLEVGALIRVAKHDNKGRLQFRGPGRNDDPRATLMQLVCYPLEVAAVQGHSRNIQDLADMEP